MGIAGYISGKPKSSSEQALRQTAASDYQRLGYEKAKSYWQSIQEMPLESIPVKSSSKFKRIGQGYIKSIAPGILGLLEEMHRRQVVTSPIPTFIAMSNMNTLGSISRARAKRRLFGRAGTLLTSLGMSETVQRRGTLLGGSI